MCQQALKLIRFSFFILVFFGTPNILLAEDFYASPNGNGDASLASPSSIEVGLSKLGAGDTLYLMDGIYNESYVTNTYVEPAIININKYFNFLSPGTTEQPITIKAYPGATPILEGDGTYAGIWIDGESNLIFEGLTVRNFWEAGVRIGYDAAVSNIVIRNNDFSSIRCDDNMGGVFLGGAENILIENNKFHDNYYERNSIVNNGLGLIAFRSKNVTIKNNEFYNLNQGMYYKHGEAVTGSGEYTRIINNYFHDLGQIGIATNQNRTEINNNLLIDSIITLHNEDGTQADFTFDVDIEHNTLLGGYIHLSGGSSYAGATRTSVKDNLIYDFNNNEHRGLSIWLYESADNSQTTVSNNLIYSSIFPTEVVRTAGGQAYSVDNLPVSILGRTGNISDQPVFVNYTGGNYALANGSPGKNVASDGTDMGADISLVGVQNEVDDLIAPSAPNGLSVL